MILLTGGLGYIGSNIAVQLLKLNYDIIIIDNLCNSKMTTLETIKSLSNNNNIIFYENNLEYDILENIFENHSINMVIHLAAYKSVNESITNPIKYYDNNIINSINLIKVMNKYYCKKIIFSSSAAVYGMGLEEHDCGCKEDNLLINIPNPYGKTKYMIEEFLRDVYNSDNSWNICILRYFNPIGSYNGYLGDNSTTNILPKIMDAAYNKSIFHIYGNDYCTVDGTCIRDYIHISDIANSHIIVMNKVLEQNSQFSVYNVGTGRGISVLELINIFMKVNNIVINYIFDERRIGDPESLFTCADKIKNEIGWKPENSIEDACISAWKCYIKERK